MTRDEENEVPNDPCRPERRETVDRSGGFMPFVLVSLGLWSLMLAMFPAWLLGSLVVVLLAGCTVSALSLPLPKLRTRHLGAPVI